MYILQQRTRNLDWFVQSKRGDGMKRKIPCGMKFLREFILADWLILNQFGKDCFFFWELIFAIFRKYPVPSIDTMVVFIEYVQ